MQAIIKTMVYKKTNIYTKGVKTVVYVSGITSNGFPIYSTDLNKAKRFEMPEAAKTAYLWNNALLYVAENNGETIQQDEMHTVETP